MSLSDRAEMVMAQVSARIESIVEGGSMLPFTRADLDEIVAAWSPASPAMRADLSGLVDAFYARTYA